MNAGIDSKEFGDLTHSWKPSYFKAFFLSTPYPHSFCRSGALALLVDVDQ